MSIHSTDPSVLFGGTWSQIEAKFLIGSGTAIGEGGESYDFQPGEVGGEYSHKLTINEMPRHNHSANSFVYNSPDNPFTINPNGNNRLSTATGKVGVDNTGGDGHHNNLPKYFVVNIWKRII